MPPNLRKSQPNLAKPSESGAFKAARKPSEPTNPLQGLNIAAERELGSAAGIKATGKLTVGVDNLISQQGVTVEVNTTNRTVGFGAGIGSTKGKLGVNIGGRVGYDEEGKISIKGAEAGINIGGFGGSASIDEDEGIRGSISVAGAKVEIGISPDGKKSVSLCYGVPGGELCVTFEPDPGISAPAQSSPTTPIPTPAPTKINCSTGSWIIGGYGAEATQNENTFLEGSAYLKHLMIGIKYNFDYYTSGWDESTANFYANNAWGNDWTKEEIEVTQYFPHHLGSTPPQPAYVGKWYFRTNEGSVTPWNYINEEGGRFWMQAMWTTTLPLYKGNNGGQFYAATYNWRSTIVKIIPSPPCPEPTPTPTPTPTPLPTNEIQLPNYPQHLKPMDCCEKVEEIYKYLGIAKLKKNKFPVSNAFLVPGGSGNDNCFDYYAIVQALFRMLANGLIINPKSKPLGSEWQNVNATAWASAMYEMMAESMSDGNSTQRFEVAAIMQLTQMMATLAENGRKIEFVADAIGIEPLPVPEDIPVCFTIYEGHKGFGKKEPKKINVSKLKTDDDVENVLGKMLNPSLIPITAWKFKPGQISINEALKNG
jgi:hypothetical protein